MLYLLKSPIRQSCDLETNVSGLKSTQDQFLKVLVSRQRSCLDQDEDHDLIQWQGYGKYTHIAVFKSRLCTA